MTRVNLLLLLLILATSMVVIRTQYESRRLTTQIELARAEARRIEVERERLDIETRTQATPLRVEKLAREQMGMRSITPAITTYVNDPRKDPSEGSKGGSKP
jgi:cell division protein FtsL